MLLTIFKMFYHEVSSVSRVRKNIVAFKSGLEFSFLSYLHCQCTTEACSLVVPFSCHSKICHIFGLE
jgi:hypothetical protein